MASKHIPIDTWLEALGMKEYEGVFRDFHGVEVGLHILKKDIGLTLFQIVEIFPMSYHKVYPVLDILSVACSISLGGIKTLQTPHLK